MSIFYREFLIDWRDVIAKSVKYKDAIRKLGLGQFISHNDIVNKCCENSILYMNIFLAICSKSYSKKDGNKFPNPYPIALMEGNDGCLYETPSFWAHPITPIRSTMDDLTILVYIKEVFQETELANEVRYISSKKDLKERGFVHKYKILSNNKIGQESGTKTNDKKIKQLYRQNRRDFRI